MNPGYEKKGVFTSHSNSLGPIRKQNIVINQGSEHYRQSFQVPVNKTNLTLEQLTGARFARSMGYTIQRPELHFKYVNGSQQQKFIPPPPQRFLINSGQSYSQPSTLPINSTGQAQSIHTGRVQPIHTVQPLYQSNKRTYIPLPIYNQIAVMNSQNKHSYEVNQANQQEEMRMDQDDQRMIEQYEKLYQNYQLQSMKVEELQRQLNEERDRKESYGGEVRQIIKTKEVFIQKPKKIDTKLLSALLINKNKAIIDEIIQRRKNSCLNKLRALFRDQQSNIKTTLLRSSEEFTSTKVRIR